MGWLGISKSTGKLRGCKSRVAVGEGVGSSPTAFAPEEPLPEPSPPGGPGVGTGLIGAVDSGVEK
eukprot:768622-Hanusia_phi.AAC.1